MPVHDWTRVDAGIFHDFHNAWITEMRRVLNGGLLPTGYYALGEQTFQSGKPDVLAMHGPDEDGHSGSANGAPLHAPGAALLTAPPRFRHVARAVHESYSAAQRTMAIRHVSGHRVVALIEVVSAGNKSGVYPMRALLDKALGALRQGVHLLVLDLHPPSPRDPDGLHAVLWTELTGESYRRPADADRALSAYSAGLIKTAYVEPVAVGQTLRDMPLFLSPDGDGYVEVPMESTYLAAYDSLPRFYRRILEAPAGAT